MSLFAVHFQFVVLNIFRLMCLLHPGLSLQCALVSSRAVEGRRGFSFPLFRSARCLCAASGFLTVPCLVTSLLPLVRWCWVLFVCLFCKSLEVLFKIIGCVFACRRSFLVHAHCGWLPSALLLVGAPRLVPLWSFGQYPLHACFVAGITASLCC